jgi:hypothetical protein
MTWLCRYYWPLLLYIFLSLDTNHLYNSKMQEYIRRHSNGDMIHDVLIRYSCVVHAQLVYASGMYVYTHVLFLDGVRIYSNEALYGGTEPWIYLILQSEGMQNWVMGRLTKITRMTTRWKKTLSCTMPILKFPCKNVPSLLWYFNLCLILEEWKPQLRFQLFISHVMFFQTYYTMFFLGVFHKFRVLLLDQYSGSSYGWYIFQFNPVAHIPCPMNTRYMFQFNAMFSYDSQLIKFVCVISMSMRQPWSGKWII